ncbi:hypothetical protein IMG5_202500 [Ichthyophthirius multifiliis]|uniref:Uncharacterized protein n=1 Tax=Ichthyophthirius multifiliis TaxID=5932 RepID=G0R646_ICHMU|nr:hypothetical protein IMG5_202500 [Ichthyophthirius multifiliis]EGR27069.1 hypothetical protein IMG5_202500 [Ichthyophthirius multifiliis]|eukprot:XP_004023953.1 hypothetical protein IMG5_202500 [Ichthyophthirius multifiliis]
MNSNQNNKKSDIESGNRIQHNIKSEQSYMNENKLQNKVIQDQKDEKENDISFFNLFRYANKQDKILIIIGCIASAANGILMPLFSIIFGEMTDSFSPNSSPNQVVKSAGNQSLNFLYLAIGAFTLSFLIMSCWIISGERQSIQLRKEYFQAIMRQEVGWFDMNNPNQLATKIAQEITAVQGAIGEKIGTFIMTITMTLGGFVVGYSRGWLFSLVTTSALPVISFGAVCFAIVLQTSQKKIQQSYAIAGGLAEQSLNAIRTVKSLVGEEYELKNYSVGLIKAFKIACSYGILSGCGLGIMFCTMFLDYSLSFWYGSKLIGEQKFNETFSRAYTQGDVFVVFFSIMIGGFSMGQAGPCLNNFSQGKQAAKQIFKVIDRKPLIVMPENPIKINSILGNIEFKDVEFNYPAKQDIKVLKKINLKIKANQKTALVGESGCGKSTIIQLIERFYDSDQGQIFIDGHEIRTLDYKWLRQNIGYVGQEPVLFATTIRENLKLGKSDATEQEMIEALKQANAWEFIEHLENKLDTYVGNSGSQISGGQKQRICIARAILKNPQILLLDEATSALDRKNESLIQKTLDEISKGRTTIVIAHRLSTIQNADTIIVLDKGNLVEQGTYSELINAKGKFESLAKNQIEKEQKDLDQDNDLDNQEQIVKDQKNNLENQGLKISQKNISKNQSIKKQYNKYIQINIVDNQNNHIDKQVYLENSQDPKRKLTKQEIEFNKKHEQAVLKRLYQYNKEEAPYKYIGLIFALCNGTIFPLSGLILGEFVDTLSRPFAPDFRDRANKLALYFLIIALSSWIINICQFYFFSRVGEGLTLKIRQEVFKKMLKMPMNWFDQTNNNPGNLSSRLATDAHLINSLTSNVVSIQTQNLSSLITGIVAAFFYSWRVSLVAIAVSPLMIISGGIQAKFVQGFSEGTDEAYKDSGMIIMESVTNIRTVYSFSNEEKLFEILNQKLEKPALILNKKGYVSGIMFGLSQFIMFNVYGIIFYVGAIFVRDNGVSAKEMFVSIFCIMFAAFGAGNSSHFMGDVGAAINAAVGLFKILDSEDEIQISQKKCNNQIKQRILGNIEFKDVSFKYPSRQAMVFKHLSFNIKSGQKVAFVGSSGSGKSSVLQLLLRYYDNYTGQILVDGKDIKEYDIREFRKSFGVVSQEPVLFNGTIAENIQYNTDDIKIEEIKEAARQANALKFIEDNQFEFIDDKGAISIGSGFDRQVGIKGSQISGGQKQRIAIARAIIKNPNVLLLDEATSALDDKNEQIVQEALNNLMKNKTSLCIAHRLSTIKDSDQIFVIEEGKLVEQGTYQELMNKKQFFYRLNNV